MGLDNIMKTWFLFLFFLTFVIGIGWLFSYIWNNPAILWLAAVFSILTAVGSYWFSDKLVLAMSKAKPLKQSEHPELYALVERLCRKANLPMPKLYIAEEAAPNAFATGRNYSHSAVAVTRGLIDSLSLEELEGVIAHELSHIKNRDMLVSTMAVVLGGFLSILSDFFLRSLIFGGRRREDSGWLLLAGIAVAVLAPLGGLLIRLAISRNREFLADISGAKLTNNPQGLASALKKISGSPLKLKSARTATAHLWIESPIRGSSIAKLFMTHPPVEERIKKLNELSAGEN